MLISRWGLPASGCLPRQPLLWTRRHFLSLSWRCRRFPLFRGRWTPWSAPRALCTPSGRDVGSFCRSGLWRSSPGCCAFQLAQLGWLCAASGTGFDFWGRRDCPRVRFALSCNEVMSFKFVPIVREGSNWGSILHHLMKQLPKSDCFVDYWHHSTPANPLRLDIG